MKRTYFGINLTREEEERFLLLKKRMKSPSMAHTMRLLINEAYEKILSEDTPSGVSEPSK